jgi:uncharacterized protein YecE (DUF72 family)
MQMQTTRVGTAGWNVPVPYSHLCEQLGSHLERYAKVMNCVEINSSFYKPHKRETWRRWAATVPDQFKFAVKAPKAITHERALTNCGELLAEFLNQIGELGRKLGPVLFQLPPKHLCDESRTRRFLIVLRELHYGQVVIEPRHVSWFTAEANRILEEFRVARVAADPAPASPSASEPGGFMGLRYYRWHGSPDVYRSAYDTPRLADLAMKLAEEQNDDAWVIFDNTALGAAFGDALKMQNLLSNSEDKHT